MDQTEHFDKMINKKQILKNALRFQRQFIRPPSTAWCDHVQRWRTFSWLTVNCFQFDKRHCQAGGVAGGLIENLQLFSNQAYPFFYFSSKLVTSRKCITTEYERRPCAPQNRIKSKVKSDHLIKFPILAIGRKKPEKYQGFNRFQTRDLHDMI